MVTDPFNSKSNKSPTKKLVLELLKHLPLWCILYTMSLLSPTCSDQCWITRINVCTEWCWTELGFTSVEQSNGVFTIKKEIAITRIELWTSWKKSHVQKLTISTCTMLHCIVSGNSCHITSPFPLATTRHPNWALRNLMHMKWGMSDAQDELMREHQNKHTHTQP